MNSLPAVLGISSAVVNIIALTPYIRDVFRKKTKPERAAWWIWFVLGIIAFFAQAAAGATWSLLLTGTLVAAFGLIAALSVNYGYGNFKKKDIISLIIALMGLVLWKFTHQPLAALLIIIGVDIAGFYLLVTKTWEAPHTETLIAWQIAALASLLGLLSVASLNFTRLLYPAYILLGDIVLIAIIITRRPKVSSGVK